MEDVSEQVPVKMSSPSCSVIFGATGCGKTQFTRRLLLHRDQIFDHPIEKILYCYTAFQPIFDAMEKDISRIEFHQGLPSEQFLNEFTHDGGHYVCVLDDLQNAVVASPDMERLFCITSHHKNVNVLFLVQNLYAPGKHARSVALQAHYLIAMKSLRDRAQLAHLSRQVFGKSRIIPEVFDDVAKEAKYPYLLIDLAPHSDDRFRLRSHIFPGDTMVVYRVKS
jgi:hypothetical protein